MERIEIATAVLPSLIASGHYHIDRDKKRICDIALTYADMLTKRNEQFPDAFAGEVAMKRKAREEQWADIAEYASKFD